MQLVTKYTLTSDVNQIRFTGLDNDCQYTMVAKNVSTTSAESLEMAWLDASGNLLNGSNATGEKHQERPAYNTTYWIAGGTGGNQYSAFFGGNNTAHWRLYGKGGKYHPFIADFSTDNYSPSMIYRNWNGYYSSDGMCEAWLSIDNTPWNNVRINGIQLKTHYGNNFTTPTEIMLYKYVE